MTRGAHRRSRMRELTFSTGLQTCRVTIEFPDGSVHELNMGVDCQFISKVAEIGAVGSNEYTLRPVAVSREYRMVTNGASELIEEPWWSEEIKRLNAIIARRPWTTRGLG
jgi:hypothetical protein